MFYELVSPDGSVASAGEFTDVKTGPDAAVEDD